MSPPHVLELGFVVGVLGVGGLHDDDRRPVELNSHALFRAYDESLLGQRQNPRAIFHACSSSTSIELSVVPISSTSSA